MIIYHGSKNIITKPEFGKGNIANDYGLGFYCTENIELAKEWACSDKVTNCILEDLLRLTRLSFI